MHILLLLLAPALLGACALRPQTPFGQFDGADAKERRLPPTYVEALDGLLQSSATDAIQQRLAAARQQLEDTWGARKADRLLEADPVFNSEQALVRARKGDFAEAGFHLKRALEAHDAGVRLTGAERFTSAPLALDDRLYDQAEMHAGRDRAILYSFRDFYILEAGTERDFVTRVMRRTHRFPPQPSLFPGSMATIPIEIVNDWHYRARRHDLLTWQRFGPLPSQYSPRQERQVHRALAFNLLVVGLLQGDKTTIAAALARLESGGPPLDTEAQGALMFGHFVLGNAQGVERYADPVLKPILMR